MLLVWSHVTALAACCCWLLLAAAGLLLLLLLLLLHACTQLLLPLAALPDTSHMHSAAVLYCNYFHSPRAPFSHFVRFDRLVLRQRIVRKKGAHHTRMARIFVGVLIVLIVILSAQCALASPAAVEGYADFAVTCPLLLLAQTPIKLQFALSGFVSQRVNFTVNLSDSGSVECANPVSHSRAGAFSDDEFLVVNAGSRLGRVTINAQAHGEEFKSYETSCNTFVIPGWCCFLPFIVTVSVAIYSKNVLVAMFTGLYVGAIFLAQYNPLSAFLRVGDTFMFLALKNANLGMLLFTFFMSGMIGVVNKSDGFRAMAARLNVFVKSSRGAQLATLFAGLLIFFDDYSNTLIIGPSLLPVTDAARVSREKLAFLVDSTSASVTSMMLLRLPVAFDVFCAILAPHLFAAHGLGLSSASWAKNSLLRAFKRSPSACLCARCLCATTPSSWSFSVLSTP